MATSYVRAHCISTKIDNVTVYPIQSVTITDSTGTYTATSTDISTTTNSGRHTVNNGTSVKFTANIRAQDASYTYSFSKFNRNTVEDFTANPKTYTVNSETTFLAYGTATKRSYTVKTAIGTDSGSIDTVKSITGSQSGTWGTKKTITATCKGSNGWGEDTNGYRYTFTWWKSSDTTILPGNSNPTYTFTIPKNGTITLTATGKKVGVPYTVKYNANGGSGNMSNTSATYGTAFNLRSNSFTKTGYTFAGWATSSSGSVVYNDGHLVNNLTQTRDATVNLYAKWTANTYVVNYSVGSVLVNSSGTKVTGVSTITSGSTASSSHTYDTAKALTSNGFTRTKCKFLGWATSSSSSTIAYTNSQSVTNLTSTSSGAVWLYAVWLYQTSSATFYPNTGTVNGSSSNISNALTLVKDTTLGKVSNNIFYYLPIQYNIDYTYTETNMFTVKPPDGNCFIKYSFKNLLTSNSTVMLPAYFSQTVTESMINKPQIYAYYENGGTNNQTWYYYPTRYFNAGNIISNYNNYSMTNVGEWEDLPYNSPASGNSVTHKVATVELTDATTSKQVCNVTFDCDGGYIVSSSNTKITLKEYINERYILPPVPTKSGKTFLGWWFRPKSFSSLDGVVMKYNTTSSESYLSYLIGKPGEYVNTSPAQYYDNNTSYRLLVSHVPCQIDTNHTLFAIWE